MSKEIPKEAHQLIIKQLQGTISYIMKARTGKGPQRIKVNFNENDIIVKLYTFLNKGEKNAAGDPLMAEKIRDYHISLVKMDLPNIQKYFLETFSLKLIRVFCDFDIDADEAVLVFRCE